MSMDNLVPMFDESDEPCEVCLTTPGMKYADIKAATHTVATAVYGDHRFMCDEHRESFLAYIRGMREVARKTARALESIIGQNNAQSN